MSAAVKAIIRAASLFRSALVWDNHTCLPLRTDATFLPQLERYRQAGIHVVSINVGYADFSLLEHLKVLSYMRQWLGKRPEAFRLVSTVEDVKLCRTDGKLGVVFDIEGMCPVQNDLSFVQSFYELGVRWMLIAYNRSNKAGGGCMEQDGGLTALGRAIIDEMERVGMVLCLSHAGGRTAAEALEYTRNPPIFSHSNPYGDTPHARNIQDGIMQMCAKKGGVIGLSGIGPFLGAREHLVQRLLSQLRYVINLVGPEHVGLGLDYVMDTAELDQHVRQNPTLYPDGVSGGLAMVAPESMHEIAEGLSKELSESQVRGILGGNWVRIAGCVWR